MKRPRPISWATRYLKKNLNEGHEVGLDSRPLAEQIEQISNYGDATSAGTLSGLIFTPIAWSAVLTVDSAISDRGIDGLFDRQTGNTAVDISFELTQQVAKIGEIGLAAVAIFATVECIELMKVSYVQMRKL